MRKLRIISYNSLPFANRLEAGNLLAVELAQYLGKNALVIGIPRGGVVVASAIAEALEAELDIMLAHKLRTPGFPELALGSVAEDGRVFLNEAVVNDLQVANGYIEQEKQRQMAEMDRRRKIMRQVRPKVPLTDRVVILTDDGIATGATAIAALWAARMERPSKLIAAIPVGPEDTIRKMSRESDELICLRCPPMFQAVGQFYVRFEQVGDDEVLKVLDEATKRSEKKE